MSAQKLHVEMLINTLVVFITDEDFHESIDFD